MRTTAAVSASAAFAVLLCVPASVRNGVALAQSVEPQPREAVAQVSVQPIQPGTASMDLSGTPAAHLGFLMPDETSPTYRVATTFTGSQVSAGKVERVTVNGQACTSFTLLQSGREVRDRQTQAGIPLQVIARFNWRTRQTVDLAVHWTGGGLPARASGTADQTVAGWWNGRWSHHVGLLLTETAGVARQAEPVHISLSIPSERITSPAEEIRVVSYAPDDPRSDERGYIEVPSQVYNVRGATSDNRGTAAEEPPSARPVEQRVPAVVTFDLAFPADVPAYRTAAYLVFYGNAHTSAARYRTTLAQRGSGLGCTVENEFYRVVHAPRTGAVRQVWVKPDPETTVVSWPASDNAMRPSPIIEAPPPGGSFVPGKVDAELAIVSGPVFCMVRSWGAVPTMSDVRWSSTKLYYDDQPYFVISETLEFTQERTLQSVRMAELGLAGVPSELAYAPAGGAVGREPLGAATEATTEPRVLPPDTHWLTLLDHATRVGLTCVPLQAVDLNLAGGLAGTARGQFVIARTPACSLYFAPLGWHAPDGAAWATTVPTGTVMCSQTAWWPIRLGDHADENAQNLQIKLHAPLRVDMVLDAGS